MKVTVDMNLCDQHGQCIYSAPEVFAFTDDGQLAWDPSPEEAQHDAVREAADVCPAQAIRIQD